ncbi:MAG: XdhC family protein, partial [Clostridia bacterium]|nr:XdhC family protein [Clostridia bacterium]
MERILRLMQEKLIRGQRCMLVTVLSRQDSAPRDAGAAMLLTEDGLIGGTIGGGAIEALAMDMAHRCLEQRRSLLRRFNLSKDAGMICGGAMALFFQFADDPLPLPGPGERGWLLTDIAADGTWTARFTSQLDHHPGQVAFDGRTLRCPIGQNMRVWIFGAGHVAQALSALLQELDFDCVILDDRESFACAERFPNAAQVRVVDLSRLSLDISANDAVCI